MHWQNGKDISSEILIYIHSNPLQYLSYAFGVTRSFTNNGKYICRTGTLHFIYFTCRFFKKARYCISLRDRIFPVINFIFSCCGKSYIIKLYLVKTFLYPLLSLCQYCISRPLCYMGLSTLYFRFPSISIRPCVLWQGPLSFLPDSYPWSKQFFQLHIYCCHAKLYHFIHIIQLVVCTNLFYTLHLGSIIDFSVLFYIQDHCIQFRCIDKIYKPFHKLFVSGGSPGDIQAFYLYRFSFRPGLDRLSSSLLFSLPFSLLPFSFGKKCFIWIFWLSLIFRLFLFKTIVVIYKCISRCKKQSKKHLKPLTTVCSLAFLLSHPIQIIFL